MKDEVAIEYLRRIGLESTDENVARFKEAAKIAAEAVRDILSKSAARDRLILGNSFEIIHTKSDGGERRTRIDPARVTIHLKNDGEIDYEVRCP